MNISQKIAVIVSLVGVSSLGLAACAFPPTALSPSASPTVMASPSSYPQPSTNPVTIPLPENESDADLKSLDTAIKSTNSTDFSGGLSDQELGL